MNKLEEIRARSGKLEGPLYQDRQYLLAVIDQQVKENQLLGRESQIKVHELQQQVKKLEQEAEGRHEDN